MKEGGHVGRHRKKREGQREIKLQSITVKYDKVRGRALEAALFKKASRAALGYSEVGRKGLRRGGMTVPVRSRIP